MNVAVTGATGFLGARIVRQLCAAGHEVIAMGHPADRTDLLAGLSCRHVPCDLLDAAALTRAMEGASVVFHVAALVTFDPRRYDRQMTINCQGTANVMASARAIGARRLVYTSTVNVLGLPPPGQIGDESTPFDWQRFRIGYFDSKRAAEQVVLQAAADGLDAVSVLPGTFFGPGDINFNAGTYIREAARGRLLAAPPGGTTVVHVDDVARGHLLALEHGRRGRRYVLGGEHVSYRTLFGWIAAELGCRPPRLTVPASIIKGAGRLAGGAGRLGLPLPLSEGLAVAACSHLYYASRRAEQELGYRAGPARQAIREAVAWYRDRGLL